MSHAYALLDDGSARWKDLPGASPASQRSRLAGGSVSSLPSAISCDWTLRNPTGLAGAPHRSMRRPAETHRKYRWLLLGVHGPVPCCGPTALLLPLIGRPCEPARARASGSCRVSQCAGRSAKKPHRAGPLPRVARQGAGSRRRSGAQPAQQRSRPLARCGLWICVGTARGQIVSFEPPQRGRRRVAEWG